MTKADSEETRAVNLWCTPCRRYVQFIGRLDITKRPYIVHVTPAIWAQQHPTCTPPNPQPLAGALR